MKRIFLPFILIFLFLGCENANDEMLCREKENKIIAQLFPKSTLIDYNEASDCKGFFCFYKHYYVIKAEDKIFYKIIFSQECRSEKNWTVAPFIENSTKAINGSGIKDDNSSFVHMQYGRNMNGSYGYGLGSHGVNSMHFRH